MSNPTINAFFEKIEALNTNKVSIFVPRLKKNLKFKPLSLGQQKNLIASLADGPTGAVRFTRLLNDIIVENGPEETFFVMDRIPIVIQLRINALGAELKQDDKVYNLKEIVEAIKVDVYSVETEPKFEEYGITINCSIPTLDTESKIISKCEDLVEQQKDNKLSDNVSAIYIHEIIKYIDSVEFDNEKLNFKDLNTPQKIKIIEKLPLSLNKQVINYIEKLREIELKYLTVENDTIDIDPSFFETAHNS